MSKAIQMARTIAAMVPAKPKTIIGGGGDDYRQQWMEYIVAKEAAIAAWKTAAIYSLTHATDNSPVGWMVDHGSNIEFIKGCNCIVDLEAMCNPAYPWSGRWAD